MAQNRELGDLGQVINVDPSSNSLQVYGSITVGNSTVNATLNATSVSINSTATNTFTVGTGSYFVANGNVGIGTSTPVNKLDIRGDLYTQNITIRDQSGSGYAYISLGSGSSSGYYSTYDNTGTRQMYMGYATSVIYGLWGESNKPVLFSANNTEQMRIAANGNIGIGTSSPDQKLVVIGNIQAGNTNTNGNLYLGGPNVSLRSAYLSNVLGIYANNAEQVRIDPNGMGIGNVTSTAYKLSIDSSGVYGSAVMYAYSNTNYPVFAMSRARDSIGAVQNGDTLGVISLNGWNGAANPGIQIAGFVNGVSNTTSTPTAIAFSTTPSGSVIGQERMRIVANGNIGIATTTPNSLLDINGKLRLSGTESNQLEWVIGSQTWKVNVSGSNSRWYLLDVTNNKFPFVVEPNATSDSLYIGTTGVCVGAIATPAAPLHIRKDQDGTTSAIIQNRNATGTPVSALQFITGALDLSDNRYSMISSSGGSTSTLQFWTSNGGAPTEKMRITGSGFFAFNSTDTGTDRFSFWTSGATTDGLSVLSTTGGQLKLAAKLNAGSYNGIVQANDKGIIYTDGSQNTGSLVIAPWANATNGFRMDSGGEYRVKNANYTFTLPNVGAAASWIKLGTFTAGQVGNHIFIKIVTSIGYNALATQQSEIYIHFKTSNGSSVDANGFAGEVTFYETNADGSAHNVKVVSNAAGVSATSFDIYYYQPGAFNGNGSFYTVELGNQYSCTWIHTGTTSADPGAASSTVAVGIERFLIRSNLGLGTSTTPVAKLEVYGSQTINSQPNVAARIGAGITSDLLLGSVNGNAPFIGSQGAYGLFFFTNASEKMRIESNGNVGIGGAPSYRLDVNSGAGSIPLRINSSSQDAAMRFECTASGGRVYHVGSTGSGSGAGNGFSIYDVTASATRMLIDPSGRITTPSQPRFKATFSTATDTTYTINTILPYNTAVYNVGSHYNTSTYRFTAPVAGYYYFRAWAYGTSSAGARATMSIRLYKNGAQDASTVTSDINIGPNAGEVGIAPLNSYGTLYLNASDYVEAYCTAYNNNSTFRVYTGSAGFEGYLIG